MPIFEYKCSQCGHTMEFLKKTRTAEKHTCPKCGSTDLQKLLSGFAVGRGKTATQTCETCPDGPCPTDICQTRSCPHTL